jgi:uncharacterized tellurite resistance protein B-like protein
MLFSFFKKHERQNAVNEHLNGFQKEFTEKQKKAILTSLLLIAHSDREYHRKEERFFEQAATLLGYHLKRDYLDELMSPDQDELFQFLNSLTEGQKDWYIITAFGMMHADGKSLEVEFKYLVGFFSRMGITEERYEKVLRKTQLLMDNIM